MRPELRTILLILLVALPMSTIARRLGLEAASSATGGESRHHDGALKQPRPRNASSGVYCQTVRRAWVCRGPRTEAAPRRGRFEPSGVRSDVRIGDARRPGTASPRGHLRC